MRNPPLTKHVLQYKIWDNQQHQAHDSGGLHSRWCYL